MAFSGQGPKKETVYSGPPPKTEGTVYDPSRQNTATRYGGRKRATPEDVKKFGNVFYAIALFSLINTGIVIVGGKMALAIGLGFTRSFDAAILKGGPIGPVLVVNGIVACVFVVLGMFARGGSATAFVIGVLLYGADTILLWQDGPAKHIPSLLFHAFFIFGMLGGIRILLRK